MAGLIDEIEDMLTDLVGGGGGLSVGLRARLREILQKRLHQRLSAVTDFGARTTVFAALLGDLLSAESEARPRLRRRLRELIEKIADQQRRDHDKEALRSARDPGEGLATRDKDEDRDPPSIEPGPLSIGNFPPILQQPATSDAKTYDELKDEYLRFFGGMAIRQEREGAVAALADIALANRGRYAAVGGPLGIPWWFIAAVHMLESGFNFSTHLHNGDPLTARTVRVPPGRPSQGRAPFRWEDSAADALAGEGLAGLRDWSLPRALYRWEQYNGLGYRRHRIPSPYLWSFSTIYEKGKFARDGEFSSGLVSAQCGAAVLLRFLQRTGEIADTRDEAGERETVPERGSAASGTGRTPFERFVTKNIPSLQFFKPSEFLVKGASHSAAHPNSDPPEELWPNLVKLALVLDEFRRRIGKQVVLSSVYRSPSYNKFVGGATGSQHLQFKAADFVVKNDRSGPRAWAAVLDAMRQEGFFAGGLHAYNTFVHVDVRGWNQNWE
ncbi:MAG: peptidase M15A [Bauldia sp.]|nr:peptidase M15A [Bauldia sp.]